MSVTYSCRERGGKYISEGEIHYTIDYTTTTSSISKDLMPKTLVVSFKSNKILFEILAPIGNTGIVNLVNPEKEYYDTYINLFGLKYCYPGKPGELHPGFESMTDMEINKTNKTSVICGYNCKNAQVTLPDDRTKIYDIWYTDEIKVKNSNMSTPFNKLEGVLLSFFFIMGKSELHFEAESVYSKEIPDKSFERRAKYKVVDKVLMDKTITDMVNL